MSQKNMIPLGRTLLLLLTTTSCLYSFSEMIQNACYEVVIGRITGYAGKIELFLPFFLFLGIILFYFSNMSNIREKINKYSSEVRSSIDLLLGVFSLLITLFYVSFSNVGPNSKGILYEEGPIKITKAMTENEQNQYICDISSHLTFDENKMAVMSQMVDAKNNGLSLDTKDKILNYLIHNMSPQPIQITTTSSGANTNSWFYDNHILLLGGLVVISGILLYFYGTTITSAIKNLYTNLTDVAKINLEMGKLQTEQLEIDKKLMHVVALMERKEEITQTMLSELQSNVVTLQDWDASLTKAMVDLKDQFYALKEANLLNEVGLKEMFLAQKQTDKVVTGLLSLIEKYAW